MNVILSYLSTNHDIKTKHAPAVLVSIYKTLQKELWFIKAGRFSLFYKYGERKINTRVCFLFLVAPVSLRLSFLHLYTGLIVYMSVHPSPLHVCVYVIVKYLSFHPHIHPRHHPRAPSWRAHTPLLAHLLWAGGLVKASCLQALLPTKISYRFPLISACWCCTPANETVCDHRTALSTLERRLPRRRLTLCA